MYFIIKTQEQQLRKFENLLSKEIKKMGLCTSKKSIEEIIHSKYTFAQDASQKQQTKQYQHVYVWRYTADDLAQKEVRFYNNENESNGDIRQDQGLKVQYLSGKPLQWPIALHSDQGYIVLTIKNFRKELQVLSTSNRDINKHSQSNCIDCIEHFRKLLIPIEMVQILFMIKLGCFRSYYYSKITNYNRDDLEQQFTAQIEIIVGDLVEKINCLKLVTITYQLEKYLHRGGQNVLKMFYNQFYNMTYFVIGQKRSNNDINDDEKGQNQQNDYDLRKINHDKQQKIVLVEGKIPIEKIFGNQITRIIRVGNYNSEEERLIQIHQLFVDFLKSVGHFHVLSNVFFAGLLLENLRLLRLQNQNTYDSTKHNKLVLNNNVSKVILQLSSNPSQSHRSVDNETLHIFQPIKRNNLNTLYSNHQQNLQVQINQLNEISLIQESKGKEMNFCKPKEQINDIMDTSLPFVCEITQIDGIRGGVESRKQQVGDNNVRKMIKPVQDNNNDRANIIIQHQGNIQQSLLLTKQFQQLTTNKPIHHIIIFQTQQTQYRQSSNKTPLLITSYSGTSQFHQLKQMNVSLVINMSPWQCYNYFINDFEYDWFWVERMNEEEKEEQIGDNDNIWRMNISCLVENIVYRIQSHLQESQTSNSQPTLTPRILIFCAHNNLIYSGTIAVTYLMLSNSYRLKFDQAYASVRQSTNGKFIIPKVYQRQLREMESRIGERLISVGDMNVVNVKSSYSAYEIGLYTQMDKTLIVGRYLGEIISSNQLQIFPNSTLKSYFLIPNNLTTIIMKSINILLSDNSSSLTPDNNSYLIKNISKLIKNMGLTLRFFYGKQQTNQQKKSYFNFVQQQLLLLLVRYQYLNSTNKIFNYVQKYNSQIYIIIQSLKLLITSQPIQKSFRKPQTFQQDPISLVNDLDLLKSIPSISKSHRNQPFNNKETLTFKYPIVRPIFQSKKKDNYYVIIKKFKQGDRKDKQMGCNVTFYKGQDWIGLEEDKQRYFEKIVHEYLSDVDEQRIWIQDEQSQVDESLFDRSSILF